MWRVNLNIAVFLEHTSECLIQTSARVVRTNAMVTASVTILPKHGAAIAVSIVQQ